MRPRLAIWSVLLLVGLSASGILAAPSRAVPDAAWRTGGLFVEVPAAVGHSHPELAIWRQTADPGAAVSVRGWGDGTILLFVVSGRMAVRSASDATLSPAPSAAPSRVPADTEIDLRAGAAIAVSPDADWSFRTEGDEPAVAVGAFQGGGLPAYVAATKASSTPAAAGVAVALWFDAMTTDEVATGDGGLQLLGMTVPSGELLPASRFMYTAPFDHVDVLVVESGTLDVVSHGGTSVRTGGRGNILTSRERAALAAGDAFYEPRVSDGDMANPGAGPAELLVLRLRLPWQARL